jgi:uncharacterized integral membrane protein
MPTFILSVFCGFVVYVTISNINIPLIIAILIATIEGLIVYVVLAKILGYKELEELVSLIHKTNK